MSRGENGGTPLRRSWLRVLAAFAVVACVIPACGGHHRNFAEAVAGTAGDLPYADVSLEQHLKTTYLFLVDGPNTITQTQSRGRTYGPAEDPTDPAGGVLGTLRTTPRVYTRYAASDVDLLLP